MAKQQRVLPLRNRFVSWLLAYEWLAILLGLIFFLRIPSLYEPHWYGDEEIYLTLGQAVRKGLVLYRDIHDNKPPLLYLVAALAGDVFWFKLALLVVHATTVVFFAFLAEKLLPKPRQVMVATIVFGLLSTLPGLEGNVANGELFMIWPATMGAYLFFRFWKAKKTAAYVWISVGLLFSAAFLFKVPIVFDLMALLFGWWFLAQPKLPLFGYVKRLASRELLLILFGFLLPIALTVVYYASQGALGAYVRAAFFQNVGYLSSWGKGNNTLFITHHLVWRGLLLLLLTSLIGALYRYRKLSVEVGVVSLWAAFSLYGSLISNRPYPHYLLQPLVPFSLLIGFLMSRGRLIQLAIISFVVIFSGTVVLYNGMWYYPVFSYYGNFWSLVTGQKSLGEYQNYFGKVVRNYAVADYIRQHANPNERIFVWGNHPEIYALSWRLPVGRYTSAYHIVDFNGFEETYAALVTVKPTYIVVFADDLPPFPQLQLLLGADYLMVRQFDGATVYRLFMLNDSVTVE